MILLPQVTIKKILYATDLSENARFAFAHAVSLAGRYQAGITLLHVLPDVPNFLDKSVVGYIGADRWEEIKQRHFDEARQALIGKRREHVAIQEVLGQFAESAQAEAPRFDIDEIVVERGNPAQVILAVAESRRCDIIVMGKTGQGVFEGALMGSTANRVVRRSKKPVLVVRYPDPQDGSRD